VWYGALGVLAMIVMTAFFGPTDNWRWDPSFYYAQIRSPLIEHDLDFRNETQTGSIETEYTVTGLENSPWPIGPSILWSPWFLAAHLVTSLMNPGQATGFYFPYISLVSLGSLAYGIAGLFVIYRLCRYFAGRALAWAAALLSLGATPLFFYMFRQPIMAHTTGLLAAAITVLIYLILPDEMCGKKSGILFGIAVGLCFVTRWTGLLMGVVPLLYFTDHLVRAIRHRCGPRIKQIVAQILVMLGAFVLTISPQLVLWYRLHGTFVAMPQSSSTFVDGILPANLLNVFVHSNRGLVFWGPFVLVGMVGIVFIPHPNLRRMASLFLISYLLLISFRVDWFSGGGFGARYFIDTLPFTAIGFVCLAQKIPSTPTWKTVLALGIAVLLVHQSVLMISVERAPDGWIHLAHYLHGEPIGHKWQATNLIRLAGNPSLWFMPRPYVADDRQTILTNIRASVRDLDAYLITGTATILSPLVIFSMILLRRFIDRKGVHVALVGTMAYMVSWSVYLFLVG
jgi:hypothetical protein